MVCNVSDSTAMLSNAIYTLNYKLDEYERCVEMLARVNELDRAEPISQEILDYVSQYSTICAESFTIKIGGSSDNNSSGGVVGFIKKILNGLKSAIIKIYEFIVNIFRTLFDKQYRARKQFMGITKHLILLGSNPDLVKQFEAIPCSVIAQSDAIDVINKSRNLINLIKFCAASTDHKAVDDLLIQFGKVGSVVVKDDHFTDQCASIAGRRWNSFAQAGWTLKGFQACIDAHINSLSGVETLKETKDNLEKEAKALEKRINDAINANTSVESVRDLQQQVAFKLRLVRLIGNSIAVINNRSTGISNVLRAIHGLALKLLEDKGVVDKTFLRKVDEFMKS